MSRRERRSRVLEYYAARQQPENQEEEPQAEDSGSDPFEGLDQSFGLLSGKESSNG